MVYTQSKARRAAAYLRRHLLAAVLIGGIAVFTGIHIVLYIHPSAIESAADLNARLTDGKPTVVEYYSNL